MQPLSKRVPQKRNKEIYAYEGDGSWEASGYRTRCQNGWTYKYRVYDCVLGLGQECDPDFDSTREEYITRWCGC